MTKKQKIRNKHRWLLLVFLSLLLSIILLSLPVYSFRQIVYSKRHANTPVDSEKYIEAKALAQDAMLPFGEDAKLYETVTHRTNSKGETTTMVAFEVGVKFTRNGWSWMKSGLLSGHILLIAFGSIVLASLFAVLSYQSGQKIQDKHAYHVKDRRLLIACVLSLIALLLIPVFAMHANYTFNRNIPFLLDDNALDAPVVQQGMDFLFTQEQDPISAFKGLSFQATGFLWMLFAIFFLNLIGLIKLYQSEIAAALLTGFKYVAVIVLCVVILYPYFVMFITGFRTPVEANDMRFRYIFPTKWIWSNMTDILNRGVPQYLLNSAVLSAGATLIAMLCGIPAAYAMARMDFKGKKAYLGFVIMSQMFAPVVLLVGISQLMTTLKLNNTILGLIFINAAFNQAFAIWLLRGTFISISSEMEQAACIDGTSTVGALLRILLPMAAPGIVTTLIFVFINSWNEYTISTVLIATPTKKPITVGITQFSSFNMIEWHYLFAAALLATLPVIVLFMLIEKHLVSGLTSGGVKG